jgi:hypothetical protein
VTPDKFDKLVDQAIKDAAEYQRKIESGELPITPLEDEIKVWPLWEISLTHPYPGMNVEPVRTLMNMRLQTFWSPMEYSHDDKDKGTE